jgi:hypothetical protein
MTIDMTHGRRAAACLVAGIGVVLTLVWVPGVASATTLDRDIRSVLEHGAPDGKRVSRNQIYWPKSGVTLTLSVRVPGKARAARFSDCPRGYACLWQDAGATRRRVQFYRYGRYVLSHYGMPAGRHQGASSQYNNQTGGAGAYLAGDPGTYWMYSPGNLPRRWNDKARVIHLVK